MIDEAWTHAPFYHSNLSLDTEGERQ